MALVREASAEKTEEDQYRQKVEDVFSGQEPVAKISGDVNSEVLPVFKSARDAQGCQDDIKQKKMEGRWHVGEVTHDRGHGHVFRPYFFWNWPSAWEWRHLTNHNKEGKAWKAKAAASTQQSTGLDAKPSTQSPHILLWPAALGRLTSPETPHPHRQASHPPGAFFSVHATPVIYSFNDKSQTSTHSTPESKDNHIRADDTDGNQTWAGSSDTDVDLHKSEQYRGAATLRGSAFSTAERKNTPSCEMRNMDSRRQYAGREFLSLQPPHRASTISSNPTGLTAAETRQLDAKDKDPEGTLCQVHVPRLPSLWRFLVTSLLT